MLLEEEVLERRAWIYLVLMMTNAAERRRVADAYSFTDKVFCVLAAVCTVLTAGSFKRKPQEVMLRCKRAESKASTALT